MATGRVSFPWATVQRWHRPGCGHHSGRSGEGSRPRADRLLNQANWWARPVPATTTNRSTTGHTEAARSSLSHVGSPAPSLAVLHPGAPQRHTHRSSHRDVPNRGDQGGPRLRPARPVAPTALRPDHGFRIHFRKLIRWFQPARVTQVDQEAGVRLGWSGPETDGSVGINQAGIDG